MNRTSQEQIVTVKGNSYKIKKFTPEVGCYWATKLFGDMVGMVGKGDLRERLPQMIKQFTSMERKEFALYQRDCLSFVSANFNGTEAPLVNSEGYFTQPDIPGPVVLELTLRSFMFTIVDFLDQSLLESILGAVPEDLLEKTGSSDSSSPQSGSNTGTTTTSGTESIQQQISFGS